MKVLPLERMIAEGALASGGVDLYVGIPGVSMPGCRTRRFFDDVLLPLRRARRVVLTVPHFSNALAVVARSELLTVVPRNLAELHRDQLCIMKIPLALPPLSVSMFWHHRVHADAGVKALRGVLAGFVGADRRLRADKTL